jgi:hypothetical protein
VAVRVGGSFVYPPTGVDPSTIEKAIFVAGGVGIKYVVLFLRTIKTPHSVIMGRRE